MSESGIFQVLYSKRRVLWVAKGRSSMHSLRKGVEIGRYASIAYWRNIEGHRIARVWW